MMGTLLTTKLVNRDTALIPFDIKGGSRLHLKEELIDFHETRKVVGPCVDYGTWKLFPCSIIQSIAHISFPESEHLAYQVILEEVHTCKHIVHRTLLHPFGKGQKFSRCIMNTDFLLWIELFLENLHNTLSANSEIFRFEFFVTFNDYKVIGSELGWESFSSVAIQKFDRHVASMFGKEWDGLFTCLDALL